MIRSIQGLLCILSVALLLPACSKKEWDEVYNRPDTLANPIYQTLQDRGNFKSLLKVIDKTSYKQTLSAAGFWTFFAPTDQAFDLFLKEKGYASADDIPAELAENIIRYSLTYDAEKKANLSDYLSRTGVLAGEAFRRRTTYYDFVYSGKNKSNQDIKIIDANRNGTYLSTDFNNKNIPVYTQAYFNKRNLTALDYTSLYPGSSFTGFNIGTAQAIDGQYDVVAENGVIHSVDKVLTPPLSIDQYINSKSEYSEFKKILDLFVNYNANADIAKRYNVLTGSTDNVFVKQYDAQLAFSPNNENYLKVDANDAQQSNYSILTPTNQVVLDYAKRVLLKYFSSGTSLSTLYGLKKDVLTTFINSHMFTTPLWASKFNTTSNQLQELIKLNYTSDVTDKQALSNGFLYGVSKVHQANKFSTVYGNIYLDPKFSIMNFAVDAYNHGIRLQAPSLKSLVIPVSNLSLVSSGYTYDPFYSTAPFRFNGAGDNVRLRRIMESHVIDFQETPVTVTELNTGKGYLRLTTIDPEYIKYDKGRLISSGTLDSADVAKQSVKIDSIRNSVDGSVSNGLVVYSSGILMYTEKLVGEHIAKYGALSGDPYFKFYQYLFNRTNIFTQGTKAIAGVDLGSSYTVFIPTNAQIDEAVRKGDLPGTFTATTVTPTYNPAATDQVSIDKITRFIQAHIVKKTVTSDGREGTPFMETLLKNQFGDPLSISVSKNTKTELEVKDPNGNVVVVNNPLDSYLSNRTIIHQINSYFKYTY